MELLDQSVYTFTVLMDITTLSSTEFLDPFTLQGKSVLPQFASLWRLSDDSGLAGMAQRRFISVLFLCSRAAQGAPSIRGPPGR